MPRYPPGYHHFNCEDTMLLKQPDVVMLMHMLPDDFDVATKKANFEFYEARTLHKSSLSPAIHAIMGIEVGDPSALCSTSAARPSSTWPTTRATPHEGIHIASAGGTWQILVYGFGGFRVEHHQMTFNPWLPRGVAGASTSGCGGAALRVGVVDRPHRGHASTSTAPTGTTSRDRGRPVDPITLHRRRIPRPSPPARIRPSTSVTDQSTPNERTCNDGRT